MPNQQKPCAPPQERKAGRHDQGQIFEDGATHGKVVLLLYILMERYIGLKKYSVHIFMERYS